MSVAHHIYITDGLLFTTDRIKSLEMVSNSSIVFSFMTYGMNSAHVAGNIAAGFGYVVDHHFIKFLATITNGFYALIDENLNLSYVQNKKLLFYPSLSLPYSKTNANVVSKTVNLIPSHNYRGLVFQEISYINPIRKNLTPKIINNKNCDVPF